MAQEISQPSNSELTKGDIINFLDEEPEKEDILAPDKKEGDKKTDVRDKPDEDEKEKEDEDLEEIRDEPDESLEFASHASKKVILKKYPELFKEFPSLERAYYKEQQYTELLPTIDDAKEVIEKAGDFDKFQQSLLAGDVSEVLKSVRETNEKAFIKIVDDYLPTLAKVDKEAYYHVIGGVIKNTIVGMVQESKNTDNEQLKQAAAILNQFIFGTSQFTPHHKLGSDEKIDKERTEIEQERAKLVQEKFDSARNDLETRTNNVLKSTISEHIDPKGAMTDYVKRTAIREAMESVESLIEQDSRFRSTLDGLWKKAFETGFTRTSLDQIKAAYLSKAKTLLPSVISRIRNEALKGLGKHGNDEDKPRRGPLPVGGGRSSSSSSSGKEKEAIPKGMKTLDYLMKDD
jgi:hypothetical protein